MSFTKAKIGLFLVAVLVLGWLLYPRAVFLGYIYEGKSRLDDAEKYYRQYLERDHYNKFATLRLAALYEKMGDPEKATLFLERLFNYRKKDWEIAQTYLEHLKILENPEKAFKARLEVVERFRQDPLFPQGRLEEILYEALQDARWRQKEDRVEEILEKLIALGRNAKAYEEELNLLWASQHKDGEVIRDYEERLGKKTGDRGLREDLIAVYQVQGRWNDALRLVDEALVFSSVSQWDPQWTFLKGELLKRLKRFEDAIALYEAVRERSPEKQENWLNLIYAFEDFPDKNREERLRTILPVYLERFPEDGVRRRLYDELLFYSSDLPPQKALVIGHDLLTRYPKDDRVVLRMAYLSAEQKDFQASKEFFESYASRHPHDPQALLLVGQELHAMGYYANAVQYLKAAVESSGRRKERYWFSRNQMALAQLHNDRGLWREALADLKAIPNPEKSEADIQYLDDSLHRRYDSRVGEVFEFSDLEGDSWQAWTTSFQSHLGRDWKIRSNVRFGNCQPGDLTGEGRVLASFERDDWSWGIGLGGGGSKNRKVFFPQIDISYGHASEDRKGPWSFQISGELRSLRTDLAKMVDEGASRDWVDFSWESLWAKRVVFSGSYRFEHTILTGGEAAQEHAFAPALAFILNHKPYITLGYQFSLSQVSDHGLLDVVGLIPKSRTHYLTALANIPFSHGSFFEMGAYIGGDGTRDLDFFRLFGLRGRLEWAIVSHVDGVVAYEYGRQTQNTLAGDSHRGTLGISVHW